MLFPTVTFAIFFVVVFVLYWSTRSRPAVWKPLLLVASWVFFAWWDWRFVLLLGASILVNHVMAGRLSRSPTRAWLATGIVLNLVVLGFFKYATFVVTTIGGLVGVDPRIAPNILVPLGISFFTFEAIAYLIEVKQEKVERMGLLDLATYMSFFPKITSGPITRASEFAPQLGAPASRQQIEASAALWLIARGLFKKLVLASYLGVAITTEVFAAPGQFSGLTVLIGIYAYTVLIYLDFSAYIDMAIGLALLLGFRLPENFDRPYTRITVTQFWSHWHMTLTRWMRDFVYTPFILRGGGGEGRTVVGLIMVMLLVGVWHGAGWTFVIFGLIHGVAMAIERLHRVYRRNRGRPPISSGRFERVVRWVVTFHIVALGWVFFGADSVATALEILGRVGVSGGLAGVSPWIPLVILAVIGAQFVPARWTDRFRTGFMALRPALQGVALGVFLLVIDTVGPQGVLPFIYFRF